MKTFLLHPIPAAKSRARAAALLGAAHLLVDMATIAVLYTAARSARFSADWAAVLILFYDYAAFAAQPFIGYALDRLGLHGKAAAAGCALAAAGAWLTGAAPVAAVAVAAAGNALFHAGGGAVCLRLDRGRAVWAGVFVAPGAIGLYLGKQIGGTALFLPWALTLLLLPAALAALFARAPREEAEPAFPDIRGFGLVAAALLAVVAVRSLVGFSVAFPWATGWQQAALLTLAAFLGKLGGGALADRLGWRNVTAAGLLLSAPLLTLGAGAPWASLAGQLCFNLTMAVTLAGLAKMLPGYEGFAFGLTAAVIAVGITPTAVPAWRGALGSPVFLMAVILLSALALWAALGRLEKYDRAKQNGSIELGG